MDADTTFPKNLAVKDCWPWEHRWTKWTLLSHGLVETHSQILVGLKLQTGRFEIQRRECVDCGACQLRNVESK
jgi:hypothetical protein